MINYYLCSLDAMECADRRQYITVFIVTSNVGKDTIWHTTDVGFATHVLVTINDITWHDNELLTVLMLKCSTCRRVPCIAISEILLGQWW